jgi:hypothetical protein
LADIRLKLQGDSQATFTPDVAGEYRIVVRDVVNYRFVPSFGGEVPGIIPASSPEQRYPVSGDNEEDDLAVDASTTYAQATNTPSNGLLVPVYQTLRREIGFGQDKATLALKVYTDQIADPALVSDVVTLTAGSTPPAKVAVYDEWVLRVLDVIEADGSDDALTKHQDLLAELVDAFNEHLGLEAFKTHTTADSTNTLTSTAPVTNTLPSIKTRLDDIVAKYNAHRVLVGGGPVHPVADNTNVMSAGLPCTTLDEAIAYYEHVYAKLLAHAGRYQAHDQSVANHVADGYFGWLAEPPVSLTELALAINGTDGNRWASYGLTQLYEQHIGRVGIRAHSTSGSPTLGADTANAVTYLGASVTDLITTANALADALRRHVSNLDATGAAASTPYHFPEGKKSRLPTVRASDVRTLAILVEELWLCFESHLWSAGPITGYVGEATAGLRGQHQDRVFGGWSTRSAPDARPLHLIRLQKVFEQALAPDSDTPEGISPLGAELQLRAGFSLGRGTDLSAHRLVDGGRAVGGTKPGKMASDGVAQHGAQVSLDFGRCPGHRVTRARAGDIDLGIRQGRAVDGSCPLWLAPQLGCAAVRPCEHSVHLDLAAGQRDLHAHGWRCGSTGAHLGLVGKGFE